MDVIILKTILQLRMTLAKVIMQMDEADAVVKHYLQSSKEKKVTKSRNSKPNLIKNYQNLDFHSHFRMSKEKFEELKMLLQEKYSLSCSNKGRPKKDLHVFCLIGLWTIASGETFCGISERFNVAKSEVCRILHFFCSILVSSSDVFVMWPTLDEMFSSSLNFRVKSGIPNIIGAIDSCHIRVKPPKTDPQSYINKQGFSSINLMAVCNEKLKFTYLYIGMPGSVHDADVLNNSTLQEGIDKDIIPGRYHLLGDQAYPLSRSIITPFLDDGHLTEAQKKFNYKHSVARVVVERAFGLLKGKFKRLEFIDTRFIKLATRIVHAACILHNFSLEYEDLMEHMEIDDIELSKVDVQENLLHDELSGMEKRNLLSLVS